MYKEAIRAAWAEINITNLDYNIKNIKEKVGPGKKITGIIKADGYGHGAVKMATVLRANGIDSFGVATLSEAVRLREAGFLLEEILVLGLTPEPYVDVIVEHRLSPVVCDYKNAEAAGDITTEEAAELVEALNDKLAEDGLYIHLGTGYRQCMIVDRSHPNGHTEYKCVPPHDILDKRAGEYLPKGKGADHLISMMKESYEILKDHPVNKARIARGLNPANSLWIWGQGTRPQLPDFNEKYGVDGAVISAVDLIKGIALFAGLEVLKVDGIDGTKHTNFSGKADAAIEAYKNGKNFIYMHIEGTDECSHQGDLAGKIKCAEDIDSKVVKPIYEYLRESGVDFKILVIPDHRTPLAIRTHSSDPVPFLIYDSRKETSPDRRKQFNERAAMESDNYYKDGFTLADYFFEK